MLYIIRHGQTEKNRANVLQGRSDVPLNEDGRRQAEALRERFAEEGICFDRVYTSPLIRAVQTAEIVCGGLRTAGSGTEPGVAGRDVAGRGGRIISDGAFMVVDERLIEMDYGLYEGMDLRNPAPEVMTFFRDFARNPAPEGMEPLPEVVARLGSFLEEIRSEAAAMNVAVSTHAIAMKGALEYLTPESRGGYWSKYIGNCAVYAAEVGGDGEFSVPEEW